MHDCANGMNMCCWQSVGGGSVTEYVRERCQNRDDILRKVVSVQ